MTHAITQTGTSASGTRETISLSLWEGYGKTRVYIQRELPFKGRSAEQVGFFDVDADFSIVAGKRQHVGSVEALLSIAFGSVDAAKAAARSLMA